MFHRNSVFVWFCNFVTFANAIAPNIEFDDCHWHCSVGVSFTALLWFSLIGRPLLNGECQTKFNEFSACQKKKRKINEANDNAPWKIDLAFLIWNISKTAWSMPASIFVNRRSRPREQTHLEALASKHSYSRCDNINYILSPNCQIDSIHLLFGGLGRLWMNIRVLCDGAEKP